MGAALAGSSDQQACQSLEDVPSPQGASMNCPRHVTISPNTSPNSTSKQKCDSIVAVFYLKSYLDGVHPRVDKQSVSSSASP